MIYKYVSNKFTKVSVCVSAAMQGQGHVTWHVIGQLQPLCVSWEMLSLEYVS